MERGGRDMLGRSRNPWRRVVGIGACAVAVVAGIFAASPRAASGADNVEPADLEVKATFNCIGIKWELKGDDNKNAACKVQFRRLGTEKWRDAMDLFRVRFNWQSCPMNGTSGSLYKRNVNSLAGSIFHLAPGTEYEVKLALSDPDGGGDEKTVKISTHPLPRDPENPNVVQVKVGELQQAVAKAKAGDVLLLEKGDHGGGIQMRQAGTPDRLIVIRGAADGESVVHGTIGVGGQYIWFDRLTIDCAQGEGKRGGKGFHGDRASKEIFVTRCNFRNMVYGCHVYGHRWFITDCTFTGDREWTPDWQIMGKVEGHMGGEGADFNHHPEGVNVFAFNEVWRTADGVSYGDNNIDVYNNVIHQTSDDLIESDYAFHNYRAWGNRLWCSLAGISFQPFNGGPWYIFRNQVSGFTLNLLKLKEGKGPVIFVNNTLVQHVPYKRFQILFENGIYANNIWVQSPPNQIGRGDGGFPGPRMRLMDYNVYGTGGKQIWSFDKAYKLEDLKALGLEKNSHVVSGSDVLENFPENVPQGTGKHMLPKPGSVLVDGGTAIPNLIETFAGKAPDVGAYELEFGAHWTGPRSYTAGGLPYCVPPSWELAPTDALKELRDLGAPDAAANAALLLRRKAPQAYILVSFEQAAPDAAWKTAEALAATTDKTLVIKLLDGFVARVASRNVAGKTLAALEGVQIDPKGIWRISGGCEESSLKEILPGFYAALTSMQQTICVTEQSQTGGK